MTTTEKLRNYIRARYPGVALRTSEEPRALAVLQALAKELKQNLFVWTASNGLDKVETGNDLKIDKSDTENLGLACSRLATVEGESPVGLVAIADMHAWVERGLDVLVERSVKNLLLAAPGKGACVIFVGPDFVIPRSFEKSVSILDFSLPTQEDLEAILAKADQTAKDSFNGAFTASKGIDRIAVLRAARGLTELEAENAFCLSSISTKPRRITPEIVYNEKAAAVRRSGLMELIEPDPRGLEAIGGLAVLKRWILQRTDCYSDKARAYGLPSPRGCLLAGVPGTGKSLAAKCIGTALKVPTLKLDMGNMFASLVGESERRMRDALALADAISPCVVWVDEIEKGLAGTSGSGALDSGVGKRLLGTLLTYMAERKSDVFFFATANAVQFLPPELLRKGRWDELWFLSLPTVNERKAIFEIHLKKRNRDPKKFNLDKLAEVSKLFTGSECEEAIVSAMYASFTDGKEIDTQAVVNACKTTVPLAKSMKEDITAIEEWGKRRARPASSEEPTKADDLRRLLAGDLDDLEER